MSVEVDDALRAAETELAFCVWDFPTDPVPPRLHMAVGMLAAHYIQAGKIPDPVYARTINGETVIEGIETPLPDAVMHVIAPWRLMPVS